MKPSRSNRQRKQRRVSVVQPGELRRAVGGTSVGNMMEWYDFGIFAFLVPTISQVFFAGGAGSLVATFTMFAAAFIVRPLGGLFFGPLGDRLGRRKVLAITMIAMAAGTLAIGLIPGQNSIGFWAPVLLLLARLVQGFSTGGEYAGAMTFVGEHAPDTRRGFLASWLEFGTLGGYILGALVVTAVTAVIPEQALLSWGWRLPFLIAGPLGLIGLYVRMRLEETPAYQERAKGQETEDRTIGEQLRETLLKPWQCVLVCVGLVLAFNVANYMLTQYMPTYLSEEIGLPRTPALLTVLAVMGILMVLVTFAGRLSDRIGRNPVLYTGCGLLVIVSVPAFMALSQGSYVMAFLGALLIGLALLCFNSTLPGTLPALFDVGVRYGAVAIAFNASVAIFGGTTPLIASGLVAVTQNTLVPAFLLVVAGAIGAVAVYFLGETARRPLPGSTPTAADAKEARELEQEYDQESDNQ